MAANIALEFMMTSLGQALGRIANSLGLSRNAPQHGVKTITLDYPIHPRKRPYESSIGGKQIAALLAKQHGKYSSFLSQMASYGDELRRIPDTAAAEASKPFWQNPWLPPLDSAAIYSLIRSQKPAVYFEVGSGTSTKFARQAITDGGLSTRLISVDPYPRAEIDGICDEAIRQKFEDLDAHVYLDRISPGDIVFIDNSHRSFQSSDVTVFFTEMLPALPAGVTWGLHDILLPADYPEEWLARFYNEQYLLTAYLLGGHGADEVLFPAAYVAQSPEFASQLERLFDWPGHQALQRGGGAFWMQRR
jgi:hypothetical protein